MKRVLVAVALACALASSGVIAPVEAADTVAGSQGTDTSLPPTDSAVTVRGRGAYANLAITVNQTKNLVDQAVSITWTGGTPSSNDANALSQNFLQIMQCWGDDDGTVADNPGPPPEQCEQGAVAGKVGGISDINYPTGFTMSRIISRPEWANYDASVGHLDAKTSNVWLPFRAVDGTVVDVQADYAVNGGQAGNFWLNPYFNIFTTNEIAGGVTGADGKGAELMEVLTSVESAGLGCGGKVQPQPDGTKKVPKCWIVVVPRGKAVDENVGMGDFAGLNDSAVLSSPLSPLAWQHRIAIPIEFNPVDSPCKLDADQTRISGSELALGAVGSWQPALCTADTSRPPYAYGPISDDSARQQLVANVTGSAGMAVVSRPISPDVVDPDNPVVYSPLTLSGIVIGFNVERETDVGAPAEAQRLRGVRIADIHLTPRLVAKLLTQSYQQAVRVGGNDPGYSWMANNPTTIGYDKDFQRYNPEFTQLTFGSRTAATISLPEGASDLARAVWEWILADPEAKAWLDGQPDEWGMKVNPAYSTDAATNATGTAFGTPMPNTFPKSDAYCYHAPRTLGTNGPFDPPALCGTDWVPYQRGLAGTARVARNAADGAKVLPPTTITTAANYWSREAPEPRGSRIMFAMTDSASAAQFGLQMAQLSRAGDDGANRQFVRPDAAGMLTAVGAMAPRDVPTVLEPSPANQPAGAYPLTALTYAAIMPLSQTDAMRAQYAAFVEYTTGAGQVSGLSYGQLPRGYVPLPANLQAVAAAAASSIRTMTPPTTTTTTTTTSSSTTTTTVATTSATTTTAPETTTTTVASFPATVTTTKKKGPSGSGSSGGAPVTFAPASEATTASSEVSTSSSEATSTSDEDRGTSTSEGSTGAAGPASGTTIGRGPTTTAAPPVTTAKTDVAMSRYAVPSVGILALGSALGALEITKRPRRARAVASPAVIPELEMDIAMEAAT